MNNLKQLTVSTSILCLITSTSAFNAHAQDVEAGVDEALEDTTVANAPDEIIVTGRKREESLLEVPVAISVLQSDLIAQENVLSQEDLAALVPGLHFDNTTNDDLADRLYGSPSIRGVGSSGGVVGTKVSSFIDGMPILGTTGAINIGGATQVEVYNGPQSAAFGRSTFGGAINYVSRDPSEELEGSIGVNWSDTGTRVINGNVGGPIIDDILGFQIAANYENSESEDPDLYSYTDGVEPNTRGGINLSGRLVWTPTDNFKTKLTFTKDTIDDGPASSQFYATQASASECFNSLDTFSYFASGMMGPAEELAIRGDFDCELEVDTGLRPIGLHDVNRYFDQNPAEFDAVIQNLIAQGADSQYTQAEIESAVRDISTIYSIPHDEAGTETDRNRIYAQAEYLFENRSLLQFSAMKSTEDSFRQGLRDYTDQPYDFSWDAMGGVFAYDAARMASEVSDASYDEEYYELRWASPAEERLRYLLGASFYKYDYVSEIYRDPGYQAVEQGLEDRALALTGEVFDAATTFAELTENKAAYFNVSYDFTDKITGSFEGRFAADDVGTYDPVNPDIDPARKTFESFTPRLALTYSPDQNTNYYVQYAVGVSPGGVNSDLFDPDIRDALDIGIPVATNPADIAAGNPGTPIDLDDPSTYTLQRFVTFDSDRYGGYDEETLTNYEFGFKGRVLDDKLTYSGAVFHMIWEDEVQTFNIDWSHPYTDAQRVGEAVDAADIVPGVTPLVYVDDVDVETTARINGNTGDSETTGIELQGSYTIDDNWSVSASGNWMNVKYTDFCDIDLFTGIEGVEDAGAAAGLTLSEDELGNGCYELNGQTVEREPSISFNISPRYRREYKGFDLTATARVNYTGESYLDNTNFTTAPASFRTNITLGAAKDNWSGSFYIQNLFDDTSINSANLESVADLLTDYPNYYSDPNIVITSLGTDYATYRYRPPTGRSLGFRLNYNFR